MDTSRVAVTRSAKHQALAAAERGVVRLRHPSAEASLLVAIVLLACVLRAITLGQQSLWIDESVTWLLVAHHKLGRVLADISVKEVTPPLYYIIAWAWTHLAGTSEFLLRLPSAVAGVATVPVAYLTGKRLLSARAGLIAAALTALSPLYVWYSQEARAYSLFALASAVSFLFFVRARADRSNANLAGFAIASAIAVVTHYFAVFTIAGECIWLLFGAKRRRIATFASVAAVSLCGLGLLPLALAQLNAGGANWIAQISFATRLAQVPSQFAAGSGSIIKPAIVVVVACCVAVALWLGLRSRDVGVRRQVGVCLAIAGIAIAIPLALAALGMDYLLARNVLGAWFPLALGVSVALAAARGRLPVVVCTVLFLALCVPVLSIDSEPSLQRSDWHATTHQLTTPAAKRTLVLLGYQVEPLEVYDRSLTAMPQGGIDVSEIDVVRGDGRPSCWWGAACYRAFPSPSIHQPVPGFVPFASQRTGQLEVVRFRAPQPVHITQAALTQSFPTVRLGVVNQPGP